MKRLNKDSIRRYLESGLLVGCASAVISLVLTLVTWFQKEVTQPGPLTTVAHLNSWVIDNPISIAWLCVSGVLFRIFVMPYALAALEDRDSFLSRLGVLVVGSLIVTGLISLAVLTFSR